MYSIENSKIKAEILTVKANNGSDLMIEYKNFGDDNIDINKIQMTPPPEKPGTLLKTVWTSLHEMKQDTLSVKDKNVVDKTLLIAQNSLKK